MNKDIKWSAPTGAAATLRELSKALEQLQEVAKMQREDTLESIEKVTDFATKTAEAQGALSESLKEKKAKMDAAFAKYREMQDK